MRRQDIQLLALARQGDTAARCEAGRRYLMGSDGFQQHTATGLDYLTHPNVKGTPLAARVIFESLPLEEIVQLQQESALAQAAAAGSASAQIKLGAWLFTRHGRSEEGTRWLNAAAAAGAEPATAALAALQKANAEDVLQNLLRALDASGHLNGPVVAVLAARQALAANDLGHASASLRAALALTPALSGELAELIAAAVQLAEQTAQPLVGMAPNAIEAALDMRVSRGDRDASYALGRALCGLPCGVLAPTDLAGRPNMRKGVALLLRAADAGCDEAWLHLYRMHGDHSLSVANPQMALLPQVSGPVASPAAINWPEARAASTPAITSARVSADRPGSAGPRVSTPSPAATSVPSARAARVWAFTSARVRAGASAANAEVAASVIAKTRVDHERSAMLPGGSSSTRTASPTDRRPPHNTRAVRPPWPRITL